MKTSYPIRTTMMCVVLCASLATAFLSAERSAQAVTVAAPPQNAAVRPAAGAPEISAASVVTPTNSAGRDFWLAFPPSPGYTDQSLIVYVASRTAASGRILIRDNTFTPFTFTVAPDQVTKLELPGTLVNKLHPASAPAGVSDKGIRITATADVSVYGLDYESMVTDAFLAMPSHAAGKEYVVAGYMPTLSQGPSRLIVVAQEDGTQITATMQMTDAYVVDYWVDGSAWGPLALQIYTSTVSVTPVVTTASLNAGQVFVYRGAAGFDLSGSTVQSNKPVVVLGHVGAAYVSSSFAFADQLLEVMPPVSAWGRRYVGVPSPRRNFGDTFRIYAAEADTTVRVNGGSPWNIGRGQWIEYRTQVTDTKYFVSDKPIMVQQYLNGTEIDNIPGDPSMLTLAPLGQGMSEYVFTTPKDKPQPSGDVEYTNTVTILMPDVAGAAMYVDGVQVTNVSPVSDIGFLRASASITPGMHVATATVPFQLNVLGMRKDESYAYAAGSSYLTASSIDVAVSPEGEYVVQYGARCFTATATSGASPVGDAPAFFFDGVGKVITAGVTSAAGEFSVCYTGRPGERGLTALVGPSETTADVHWLNDDASLTDLQSYPAALTPTTFVSSVLAYTATVVDASTMVTPTLSDPKAVYTITSSPGTCTPTTGGGVVTPTAHDCALSVGLNVVTLTVTAEDGVTTRDYVLQVGRAACFAEYTGDGTTDFMSADAKAVQNAVDAASAGGVVKIAGMCAGVANTRAVGVDKAMTLRGGYTTTNWATSDPATYPTVLDGQRVGRVITATAPITLENLTVQNGRSIDYSSLDGVRYRGGGMYATAAVVLSNTTFYNNLVVSIPGNGVSDFEWGKGGGLYSSGPVSITASTFQSNTATSGGGAAVDNAVTVTDSMFISNSVRVWGAGLNAVGGVSLISTDFISNVTPSSGAGAYLKGDAISILGGVFRNNIGAGSGGGVYAQSNRSAVVSGTQFLTNTAQEGGGMYVYPGTVSATLWMTNASFISNTIAGSKSGIRGGGLYLGRDVGFDIVGSRFERNAVHRSDGANAGVHADGSFSARLQIARIVDTVFVSNYVGALFVGPIRNDPLDAPLEMENVQFVSNTGNSYGGGAYVSRNANVRNVDFIGNDASYWGGGLYAEYATQLSLIDVQFLSNTAASGGGAYFYYDSEPMTVWLTRTKFISNTAVDNGDLEYGTGGGVFADYNVDFDIRDSRFERNVARAALGSGGAIYALGTFLQSARVVDTVFLDNAATSDGGAVYVGGGHSGAQDVPLQLENTVFAGNEAAGLGESIYLTTTDGLHAQQTTFAGQSGAASAVVLENFTGTAALTNSLFADFATGVELRSGSGAATLNGVLWDGVTTPTSGAVSVSGELNGSAKFVDAVAGNYVAVGDGMDGGVNSGVAADIRGVARPQRDAYDLGAYEAADERLSLLEIEPGDPSTSSGLVPAFVSTTTNYTAELPTGSTSTVVTATTIDVSATVAIATTAGACTPGNASPSTCDVASFGTTTITITTTSTDGGTKVYTVEVTVAPSSDANLMNLEIHPGSLSPAFVSSTTDYTARVPDGTTSAVVTATTSDVSATVAYASTAGSCTPGNASPSTCDIAPSGTTTITITITALDGTTQEYVIAVTVAPPGASSDANLLDLAIHPGSLSPAFVSSTTSYTAEVPNGTTNAVVTATTSDVSATIAVATTAGSCTPGTMSPSTCDIAPTGTTTITITITAPDSTSQEYVIVVTVAPPGASSNANLLDLVINPGTLAPAFVSTTTSYTAEAPDGTTSTVVTATTSDVSATVTYASSAGVCTPGNASPSTCDIAPSGTTTITITITAPDGTTQEYVIVVTVAELTGPHATEMVIDIPGLTPAFVSTTLNYQTEVPSGTNVLVVTPTLSVGATAVYSSTAGACVDSGVSGACPLFPTETTTVTIGITDGTTTRNYTIRATRASAPAGSRTYWFPIVPVLK